MSNQLPDHFRCIGCGGLAEKLSDTETRIHLYCEPCDAFSLHGPTLRVQHREQAQAWSQERLAILRREHNGIP